jgi:putative transposase
LAVILDLYSHRILGWAMSDPVTGDVTLTVLKLAIQRRQPERGLIHHSDRGGQDTKHTYQAPVEAHGIRAQHEQRG